MKIFTKHGTWIYTAMSCWYLGFIGSKWIIIQKKEVASPVNRHLANHRGHASRYLIFQGRTFFDHLIELCWKWWFVFLSIISKSFNDVGKLVRESRPNMRIKYFISCTNNLPRNIISKSFEHTSWFFDESWPPGSLAYWLQKGKQLSYIVFLPLFFSLANSQFSGRL